MTADKICPHRVSIITGHYGTGKTEFAVNLSLQLAALGGKVMLADLDIVNPYFRSRERKALLQEAGIRLISSSQACSDADVPALPAELLTILENRDVTGVLDIGGDPVGARVLARFNAKITLEDYQLIYVLNANRPEVRTPEAATAYLRGSRPPPALSAPALSTTPIFAPRPHRRRSKRAPGLAAAVSRETKIPVLCHVAEERFVPALSDLSEPIFPISIKMKKPWE